MRNFRNEDYIEILTDCIHDIFYVETSYRGKIAQIRLLSEIIVRKLIDYDPDKQLTIGNHDVLEQVANLENGDYIKQCILEVKDDTDGYYATNSCSHSKVRARITESDYCIIQNHLMNLISCVFIQYFSSHKFGLNTKIMYVFSLLPPSIRYNVLNLMYIKENTNVDIIDRYVLATMKAYGADKAKEWVEKNREHLISLSAVSEDMKYTVEVFNIPDINMYECCCQKISANIKGKYQTFEESKKFFEEYINKNEDVDEDTLEFLELMEFVYIGRRVR